MNQPHNKSTATSREIFRVIMGLSSSFWAIIALVCAWKAEAEPQYRFFMFPLLYLVLTGRQSGDNESEISNEVFGNFHRSWWFRILRGSVIAFFFWSAYTKAFAT